MKQILCAALAMAALSGTAQAQDGDAAAGETVFRRCQACHAVGPDAANKVGPQLNGVVGRAWAAVPDYAYSEDLKAGAAEGKVWDEATLHEYLTNPKAVAPKGKMAFAGLKNEADRANVIAYLAQFGEDGATK